MAIAGFVFVLIGTAICSDSIRHTYVSTASDFFMIIPALIGAFVALYPHERLLVGFSLALTTFVSVCVCVDVLWGDLDADRNFVSTEFRSQAAIGDAVLAIGTSLSAVSVLASTCILDDDDDDDNNEPNPNNVTRTFYQRVFVACCAALAFIFFAFAEYAYSTSDVTAWRAAHSHTVETEASIHILLCVGWLIPLVLVLPELIPSLAHAGFFSLGIFIPWVSYMLQMLRSFDAFTNNKTGPQDFSGHNVDNGGSGAPLFMAGCLLLMLSALLPQSLLV
jgi:hypothetical protein